MYFREHIQPQNKYNENSEVIRISGKYIPHKTIEFNKSKILTKNLKYYNRVERK